MTSQNITYLSIFIVGLVVSFFFLWLWFFIRHWLAKTEDYYSKRNLNLWSYFKRNISLFAAMFFFVIALSALFIWIT
ncbi:hypothetical protein [Spiroplasma mirum]|uniref:hypothetical protein n=1 Tax=Spiroplasma mirum TaxID=2144 RepID=UPI0003E01221|nr:MULTISPECIES: hypothetical protein [Spiroplasma]AHF61344.1 hypothetical protein SMM_0968 [Spiroplasma mirum ATCC 29335]AKM53398.1 hypothetical protein SATRI_v1c10320 [Spiroplasma atrichopogonis]